MWRERQPGDRPGGLSNQGNIISFYSKEAGKSFEVLNIMSQRYSLVMYYFGLCMENRCRKAKIETGRTVGDDSNGPERPENWLEIRWC